MSQEKKNKDGLVPGSMVSPADYARVQLKKRKESKPEEPTKAK